MPKRPAKKTSTRKMTKPQKPVSESTPTATETPAQSKALDTLREKIDGIDTTLVKLLNDRAKLVVKIGKRKRTGNTPIYAPHREAQVLGRALKLNRGPLPDRTIEGVYRELMSGSFALEHPLRIGYLGPPGSYSHLASVKQFGSSVSYEDLHEIAGVVTEVRRGHVHYGLVPIENSTGGGISETLSALQTHAGHIQVYAEVQIAIHHALLSNCEPSEIRRIHSKPEVLGQCRTWLATQFPKAELIAAPSSSRSVQIAVEENRIAESIGAPPGTAAIGSTLAGQLYGLAALFEEIEDNPNNITRFYIISRQKTKRSGDDKTAIMFNTADKPGALVSVLRVFEDAGINLTHIDKRPSGRENWQYTFFIDAQGHRDNPTMRKAIKDAEKHCRELIVLGSFPRSTRIL
jgi:chorismate mutase / prephenate dehydratase